MLDVAGGTPGAGVAKVLRQRKMRSSETQRDELVPRVTADADCTGTRIAQETGRLTAMVRAIKEHSCHRDRRLC